MDVGEDEGAEREKDAEEHDAPRFDDREVGVSSVPKEVQVDRDQDAACSVRPPEGVKDFVRGVQASLKFKYRCRSAMNFLEKKNSETLGKVKEGIMLQIGETPTSGNLGA